MSFQSTMKGSFFCKDMNYDYKEIFNEPKLPTTFLAIQLTNVYVCSSIKIS